MVPLLFIYAQACCLFAHEHMNTSNLKCYANRQEDPSGSSQCLFSAWVPVISVGGGEGNYVAFCMIVRLCINKCVFVVV